MIDDISLPTLNLIELARDRSGGCKGTRERGKDLTRGIVKRFYKNIRKNKKESVVGLVIAVV